MRNRTLSGCGLSLFSVFSRECQAHFNFQLKTSYRLSGAKLDLCNQTHSVSNRRYVLLVQLFYELYLFFLADSRKIDRGCRELGIGCHRWTGNDEEDASASSRTSLWWFFFFPPKWGHWNSRSDRDVDESSHLEFCCMHRTMPCANQPCPCVIKSCLASPIKYWVTGDPVETSSMEQRMKRTGGINYGLCIAVCAMNARGINVLSVM